MLLSVLMELRDADRIQERTGPPGSCRVGQGRVSRTAGLGDSAGPLSRDLGA